MLEENGAFKYQSVDELVAAINDFDTENLFVDRYQAAEKENRPAMAAVSAYRGSNVAIFGNYKLIW